MKLSLVLLVLVSLGSATWKTRVHRPWIGKPLDFNHPNYAAYCLSSMATIEELDSMIAWFSRDIRPSKVGRLSVFDPLEVEGKEAPIPPQTPGQKKITMVPKNDAIRAAGPKLWELSYMLENTYMFVENEEDEAQTVGELEVLINRKLFDVLTFVRRFSECKTYDCSVWRQTLEQIHKRTAVYFSKKPGYWKEFSKDLKFVLRVLVTALQSTK